MTTATTKITRNGQTLTARHWALLEDAYRAAGQSLVGFAFNGVIEVQ